MLMRRSFLGLTAAAGLGLAAPATALGTSAPAVGPDWTRTPVPPRNASLNAVTSTARGTWAVGIVLVDGFADTRPLIVRRRGDGWVRLPQPVEQNAVLEDVAVTADGTVWAVGVDNADPMRPQILVLRADSRGVRRVPGPDVPLGGFASVVAVADGSIWASGFAAVGGRERGVVYRLAGGRWTSLSAGLQSSINGNALLVRSPRDAWLAVNPGLAHFDGTRWTFVDALPRDGSQIVTGLAAGPQGLWGVGVVNRSVPRPLVMHRRNGRWRRVETPGAPGQLYDVVVAGGRPVIVGERFSDGGAGYHPYVLTTRGGRLVAATPPARGQGVASGIDVHRGRLVTVGAANGRGLAATAPVG